MAGFIKKLNPFPKAGALLMKIGAVRRLSAYAGKIKPLVLMQLKDKLDFGFLKGTKQRISKVVFSLLMLAGVTALSLLALEIAKLLNVFSLVGIIPSSVATVVFALMFTLSVLSGTLGLMRTLYYAKDNAVLLTFPVTANQVFISKLIVFYVYEYAKNLLFLIPFFLALGIAGSFSFIYYPWVFAAFVFISLLPVAIGAALSIPAVMLSRLLARFPALRGTLYAALAAALFYALISAIALIPENINLVGSWGSLFWSIQDFLKQFTQRFAFMDLLVRFVTGVRINIRQVPFTLDTLLALGVIILVSAAFFALSFLLARPMFFRTASRSFEHKKAFGNRERAGRPLPVWAASVLKEVRLTLRSRSAMARLLTVAAMLPVLIFLLNKIYSAMNTRLLGQNMTLAFTLLMALLIMLSSNTQAASALSSEGSTGYLNKIRPVPYYVSVFSKLVFPAAVMAVSLAITIALLGTIRDIGWQGNILFFVTAYGLYAGHMLWSAEIDLMNPQNQQYQTTGEQVSNPNEGKSTVFGFVVSFVVFAFSLLLFIEGTAAAWIKLALISAAFFTARFLLFYYKIKVYYKEK